MANLIPPAAKKDILIEYWLRVATVWFGVLGAAALAIAVLNVPVYILVQNQKVTIASLFADASEQNTSFEKIEEEILLANDTATLLAAARNAPAMIPYVEKIESVVDEAITIESFTMNRNGVIVERVRITGVAADRESLVRFSSAIESLEEFISAEIPLSNLAKDTNIPFTINAELNASTQ